MNNGIIKKLGKYSCYGVGAIGLDLSYGMFYSYLSYYLSSLGIHSAFLLIITPLARIWDGINDPMMGTIVDNTKTKFGKYRPWIFIGAICNAVVLALLFTSFGMSGWRLYTYIAVMYVLWGMTNTMADIPYWSMVPSFTSEEKITLSQIFTMMHPMFAKFLTIKDATNLQKEWNKKKLI